MSIFEEIKEGDEIVIGQRGGGFGRPERPLQIERVTRVTQTQITAGGIRFLKRNGWQVGDPYISHVIEVTHRYGEREHLMTPDEARARNKELEQEQRHRAMARQISEVKFRELPYETLLKLAAILGIETGEANETKGGLNDD